MLISECVFAVLHPETGNPLHSTPLPNLTPVVDNSKKACCSVEFLGCKNLEKYLFNGTLTLQVTATLLCIGDPVMVSDVIQKPPDTLREELVESYRSNVFTDVIIKCEGKEFKVHKVILASQSPVPCLK